VSAQHRPYWREQARRCERLLNEPALPLQSLRIVRQRLNEADTLLRAIDAGGQPETDHGQDDHRSAPPARGPTAA